MTAPESLPLHALTQENLASASPDLLRAMVIGQMNLHEVVPIDAECREGLADPPDIPFVVPPAAFDLVAAQRHVADDRMAEVEEFGAKNVRVHRDGAGLRKVREGVTGELLAHKHGWMVPARSDIVGRESVRVSDSSHPRRALPRSLNRSPSGAEWAGCWRWVGRPFGPLLA
ncbi:hypothetical protein ABZ746_34440 [Streptomyces sp. NPDC020096]